MGAKVLPSHMLFRRFEERVLVGEVSLSEVIHSGAQLMPRHAVELEMNSFLGGREYYCKVTAITAGHGRSNGYEKRRVPTGEGAIEIEMPQARDLPVGGPPFRSNILEAYVSRSESLTDLITRMYVMGVSTRDVETTFVGRFGGRGISCSTVSRLTERLDEDLKTFRTRDLCQENILYTLSRWDVCEVSSGVRA